MSVFVDTSALLADRQIRTASVAQEGGGAMEMKIFAKRERLDWDYDPEADVLYLSLGEPQAALGVDIGEGVVVRYDEANNEVVGLTIVGLQHKLVSELTAQSE